MRARGRDKRRREDIRKKNLTSGRVEEEQEEMGRGRGRGRGEKGALQGE